MNHDQNQQLDFAQALALGLVFSLAAWAIMAVGLFELL
jgi:hypothetical protein